MERTMADSCGYSSMGGRTENEDSYGIFTDGDSVSVIVADGLGGHGGGKQASEIAVKHFSQCVFPDRLPDNSEIMACFHSANQEILESRINANHMKTTVVYLAIRGALVKWAHIGDSRLYHFWNEELCDYTLDHSVSQMAVVLGEITREQIRGHCERSRLLRVLGSEEIMPEIHEPMVLKPGRHAFLLCSDGFWESVLEDEMILDLYKSATAKEWLWAMRHRLLKRMEDDHDNHTAAAVFVRIQADGTAESLGEDQKNTMQCDRGGQ